MHKPKDKINILNIFLIIIILGCAVVAVWQIFFHNKDKSNNNDGMQLSLSCTANSQKNETSKLDSFEFSEGLVFVGYESANKSSNIIEGKYYTDNSTQSDAFNSLNDFANSKGSQTWLGNINPTKLILKGKNYPIDENTPIQITLVSDNNKNTSALTLSYFSTSLIIFDVFECKNN